MSVIKRGGRYVAKYQRDGKQVWVGTFATKREATAAEAEHRRRRQRPAGTETCRSFADRWLIDRPRQAAGTMAVYRDAAERFAAHFEDTPLTSVDRVAAYAFARQHTPNISKIIGTLYSDAADEGIVESNPFRRLRLPVAPGARRVVAPTMEEYNRAVLACSILEGYGPEFRAMLQFAAWTGVREGELAGLQWTDLDGDKLHVRRQRLAKGTLALPKGGHEREIVLVPPARAGLDDVPARPDPFVFHTPTGKPLSKGSVNYHWRAVRAAAGLDHVWHSWRHFCATQLLERGLDHFAVATQLGHRDGGKLVMSRYGHPSADAARRRLVAVFEPDLGEMVAPGSANG